MPVPKPNVFTWIIAAFPLYLVVRGRLVTYLKLASDRPNLPAGAQVDDNGETIDAVSGG